MFFFVRTTLVYYFVISFYHTHFDSTSFSVNLYCCRIVLKLFGRSLIQFLLDHIQALAYFRCLLQNRGFIALLINIDDRTPDTLPHLVCGIGSVIAFRVSQLFCCSQVWLSIRSIFVSRHDWILRVVKSARTRKLTVMPLGGDLSGSHSPMWFIVQGFFAFPEALWSRNLL